MRSSVKFEQEARRLLEAESIRCLIACFGGDCREWVGAGIRTAMAESGKFCSMMIV